MASGAMVYANAAVLKRRSGIRQILQGTREVFEMTRSQLERKIAERSVLVCHTSDPKERECYLAALTYYENELRRDHYERELEKVGTRRTEGQLKPLVHRAAKHISHRSPSCRQVELGCVVHPVQFRARKAETEGKDGTLQCGYTR